MRLKKIRADGRSSAEEPHPGLRGLRVLVVDDNAANRRILLKQTASWGMVPRATQSGPEALEELCRAAGRARPYDIAILDLQMPQMDGLELAEKIKADGGISGTRLVMLTSIRSQGQRGSEGAQTLRPGIEAYLTKPVRQSELYNTLMTLVDEQSPRSKEGNKEGRRAQDRAG